ncbi:MAG: hypothetical protein H8D97_01370 [Proteobacteria bacterium]|nr:hypothetical protein [Pseudomonadota bacterium]
MEVFVLGALFGNLWFWGYSLALVIGLIWLIECTDNGSPFSALMGISVFFIVIGWQFGVPITSALAYLGNNPFTTIALLLGYFGIGTAYGTWKWVRVMKKAAANLKLAKIEFIKKHKINGNTILIEDNIELDSVAAVYAATKD